MQTVLNINVSQKMNCKIPAQQRENYMKINKTSMH